MTRYTREGQSRRKEKKHRKEEHEGVGHRREEITRKEGHMELERDRDRSRESARQYEGEGDTRQGRIGYMQGGQDTHKQRRTHIGRGRDIWRGKGG